MIWWPRRDAPASRAPSKHCDELETKRWKKNEGTTKTDLAKYISKRSGGYGDRLEMRIELLEILTNGEISLPNAPTGVGGTKSK